MQIRVAMRAIQAAFITEHCIQRDRLEEKVGFRETLLAGKPPLVGHFLFEFATPGIGYLVRNAGADFVVLDLEHSAFGFETAKQTVLSARAAGLPIVVRAPSCERKDLARVCDIGADGVMAPNVESKAQAQAIIDSVKYVPEGRRGIGQILMHDRYRGGAFTDKASAANAALAVFVQIESVQGVSAASDIASVPGIDCLWIGHMDLSSSIGRPADFDHAAFKDSVATVLAATVTHNKLAGRLARSVDEAIALSLAGFQCIALSTDTQTYQMALTKGIEAVRAGVEHG